MLTAAHLAKGDNLRLVRPEYRDSARAAIKLQQRIEYDEAYWRRLMESFEEIPQRNGDDKPRR